MIHSSSSCQRSADWRFSSWRAITDQVRGGVSTAALEPCAAGARRLAHLGSGKPGNARCTSYTSMVLNDAKWRCPKMGVLQNL
jgi:hypothetical protein